MKTDQLAFMSGDWEQTLETSRFEEHWSRPNAGSMVGAGKEVSEGTTTFMEFMSIEEGAGAIRMWVVLGKPSEGKRPPVPFRLTRAEQNKAVFENAENTFPAKITYTLKSANELECLLEPVEGSLRPARLFEFKRMR